MNLPILAFTVPNDSPALALSPTRYSALMPASLITFPNLCFFLHATGLKRVHGISTGRSLGATVMLTILLLALATALIVYDYGLIQQAIR